MAHIIQDCGAWPFFLPPYSPDLNPIKMAFARLKQLLRQQDTRAIEALLQTVGDICRRFKQTECWNVFRHAGYTSDFT